MKIGWKGVLGIVVSAALLWWTLHDVDFGLVGRTLRGSNVLLFAAATLCGTLIFAVRARKWRTILDPVEEGVPFGPLWRSVAIGMMLNNTVPARLGEVARAYALHKERPSVPFSASFASIAVDRVFDSVVLFGLMFAAMLDPRFPQGTRVAGQSMAHVAGLGTVFIAVLLAALYAIVFFPERMVLVFEALSRRVAPKYEARGRAALHAFAEGLSVLRSPRRFVAVLWWTLLHWLLNGLAFWLGFRAVGVVAPFSAALFVQGVIAAGVAVPQAPGFFGGFEAIAKVALPVYGASEAQAVSWALGYHILSFIPITVIGAWYFVRLGLHFRELGETRTESSHLDGEAADGVAAAAPDEAAAAPAPRGR